jgi:hypothetical protein
MWSGLAYLMALVNKFKKNFSYRLKVILSKAEKSTLILPLSHVSMNDGSATFQTLCKLIVSI